MIAPPSGEKKALILDDIDRQILALLQEDASLPVSELATRVGLSTTPCWKRIHNLKEEGVIARQVVLCDPDKLQLGTTVFVEVSTNQHNETWLASFAKAVQSIPEIVEVYRMSGDVDYLLRVVVADIIASDLVEREGGHRGQMWVNRNHFLRLAEAVGFRANIVFSVPWAPDAVRLMIRFERK